MTNIRIGVAPTRRDAFVKSAAHKVRDLVNNSLKGFDAEFVFIDGVTDEGLLIDDQSADLVINFFRTSNIDGIFFPHANFGTEFAVAKVAKAFNVPVIIWGLQDDAPDPVTGMRSRDTQCGLFATGKVLRRNNVQFSYIPNCKLDDPKFRFGLETFISVCRVIKSLKHLRILQIAPRPEPFWSVICNEGELLEKFGIEVSPVTMSEFVNLTKIIASSRSEALEKTLVQMRNIDYSSCGDENAFILIGAMKSAMGQLCEERNCSAVAIQCWEALQDEIGLMPCNSNALLSDDGIPVICETDIHGAISSIILQAAADDVPFFADMTIRHPENKNAELLWHCGNFPIKHIKPGVKPLVVPNVLDRNFSCGTGNYELKQGPLTICRFDGDHGQYRLFLGEGHTIEGPKTFGTYVWFEVSDLDLWEYKLVTGPYIHHCAAVYGHVAHILYEAVKYVPGLEVELADKTEDEMIKFLLGNSLMFSENIEK
jgi:L-fucose isomerase-like protein